MPGTCPYSFSETRWPWRYYCATERSEVCMLSTARMDALLLAELGTRDLKPKCLPKDTWVSPKSYVPGRGVPYGFSFSAKWEEADCESRGGKESKGSVQFSPKNQGAELMLL